MFHMSTSLAQLVEHQTEEYKVVGLIPIKGD